MNREIPEEKGEYFVTRLDENYDTYRRQFSFPLPKVVTVRTYLREGPANEATPGFKRTPVIQACWHLKYKQLRVWAWLPCEYVAQMPKAFPPSMKADRADQSQLAPS